ncbi:hypothetical protein [Bernardetia sp.]|uniref:hypothetical protein n=1 Tax=Bernardetia sp. TaxID=1937974 RepID=UPI0025BAE0DE|nr:hypothetical protein [Bernardetia sp.]
MKKYVIAFVLILVSIQIQAQDFIVIPKHINIEGREKKKVIQQLDSLLHQIIIQKLDTNLISKNKRDFTISVIDKLMRYEQKKDSVAKLILDKQLINIYPIDSQQYSISVAYLYKKDEQIILPYIFTLIADCTKENITFSVPLNYLTRYWQKTKIGNITYFHQGKLDIEQAIIFDKKNTQIATLMGLKAEKMDFYMCDSYKEIMQLIGFDYSYSANGIATGGYGVIANTIFMNHEDFSHDVFHYYSGLVNKREDRNWIAEEGVAYTLGNAYYTDEEGKMVTQKRLIKELENYLIQNQDSTLWQLFKEDYPIFDSIANDLSVRSVISSIIVDEVLLKKGKIGVLELVNSGGGKKKFDNYMKTIDELIGINENNFNERIKKLMKDYK